MKNYPLTLLLLLLSYCAWSQPTVFPGDANANGLVDQYDVLSIGYAFGQTGAARIQIEDASIGQGIPENWDTDFPSGLNYIHADANGNGLVSITDFLTWNQNYGLTNGELEEIEFPGTNPASADGLIWNNNQAAIPLAGGQSITIPLAFSIAPEQAVNGMAFRLRYNGSHFASVGLDLSNNWLVADGEGIAFQRQEGGSFAVGISRFGANPINGGGNGGTMSFIVIDDMIALLEQPTDTIRSWVVLEQLLTVDDEFEPLPIYLDSFELKLYRESVVANLNPTPNELEAALYPNPTNGQFNVQAQHSFEHLTLFDALGRSVWEEGCSPRRQWTSGKLNLPPAYYLLKAEGAAGISYLRMIVK